MPRTQKPILTTMIRALREKCANEGFDLCHPFHTQWYNDLIEKEGHVSRGTLQKLSTPPTISENGIVDGKQCNYNAILIGNSKCIWPKFINWLSFQYEQKLIMGDSDHCDRKDDALNQVLSNNPFDTFVADTLSEVFRSCFILGQNNGNIDNASQQLASYEVYWSHGAHYKVDLNDCSQKSQKRNYTKCSDDDYHCYVSRDDDDDNDNKKSSSFLLSMQRVAKVTGKYWHDDKGTKLCVHPRLGTWVGFRAVVVFHKHESHDNVGGKSSDSTTLVIPPPQAPSLCPCPVTAEEIQKAKQIMDDALAMFSSEETKNNDDNKTNETTGYGVSSSGTAALCFYLHGSVTSGSDWSKVSPLLRPWIQMRDCISVGRDDYKYCDDQLLYHYTKDTDILKRILI